MKKLFDLALKAREQLLSNVIEDFEECLVNSLGNSGLSNMFYDGAQVLQRYIDVGIYSIKFSSLRTIFTLVNESYDRVTYSFDSLEDMEDFGLRNYEDFLKHPIYQEKD